MSTWPNVHVISITGFRGVPGVAGTIDVLPTITTAAGTNPNVINEGTSVHADLRFYLPAGGAPGVGVAVETVAALRLVQDPLTIGVVTTLGCLTANDGGGGLWHYDALSTATDNTGTVVKPTAVSGAGRWLRVWSGPINAAWFGMDGSGATDCWPALSSAIDVALAAEAELIIPEPQTIYRISSSAVKKFTGTFRITGLGNCEFDCRYSRVFQFYADDGVTLELSSPIALDDQALDVVDATGVEPGQLLYLNANVKVASGWQYYGKPTVTRVTAVSGNRIYTQHPFHFPYALSETAESVSLTASITGTTLDVTAMSPQWAGPLGIGSVVTGSGVTSGTTITALGTGSGYLGTYTVNHSQTVTSRAMTANPSYVLTVKTFQPATLIAKNLKVTDTAGSMNIAFDCGNLSDSVLDDITLNTVTTTAFNFRALQCLNTTVNRYKAQGGTYPMEWAACRDSYINDPVIASTWAAVDTSTWSHTTYVNRASVYGGIGANSHPSFYTWWEDSYIDANIGSSATGLTCLGGGYKNCTILSARAESDFSGEAVPILYSTYSYLSRYYTRVFENVYAPTSVPSTTDHKLFSVNSCNFKTVVLDGQSSNVQQAYIDRDTTTEYPLRVSRIFVVPDNTQDNEVPRQEFKVTNITNANPAVVTVKNHPFATGDMVTITGVSGTGSGTVYTTINGKYYTVGAVTSDTFELSGLDTSAYQTYAVSGTTYKVYREFTTPIYTSVAISGITKANPAVVTTSTAHGYLAGDTVFIDSVAGMTQVNGKFYTVGAVTSDTFELSATNSSSYSNYTSGGYAYRTTLPITGITRANPAVVTALGHGYSNGDEVYIAGVSGMTQVNDLSFTVANVTTDTFELSGVDSTSYSTYTSGGHATKGTMLRAINPVTMPGIGGGFNPTGFKFKANILDSTAAVSALTSPPSATLVIPVKVVNVFGSGEKGTRAGKLSLFVTSYYGDSIAKSYGVMIYGSTITLTAPTDIHPSVGTTVSSATISNVRPHYGLASAAERGGTPLYGANSSYYFTFDITVTMISSGYQPGRIDIEYEEVQGVS